MLPQGEREGAPEGRTDCFICSAFEPPFALLDPARPAVLGRDPAAGLHLSSDRVSREHARVVWDPAVRRVRHGPILVR